MVCGLSQHTGCLQCRTDEPHLMTNSHSLCNLGRTVPERKEPLVMRGLHNVLLPKALDTPA